VSDGAANDPAINAEFTAPVPPKTACSQEITLE